MTTNIIKDSGWTKQIKDLMKGAKVTAGIHEADDMRGDGGPSNALIGFWQEYGTEVNGEVRIPPRSFLRNPFDDNKALYKKLAKASLVKAASGGHSLEQAMSQIGALMQSYIVKAINSSIPPQLAESTIAQKGSTTALIDRGDLKTSIGYEVEL